MLQIHPNYTRKRIITSVCNKRTSFVVEPGAVSSPPVGPHPTQLISTTRKHRFLEDASSNSDLGRKILDYDCTFPPSINYNYGGKNVITDFITTACGPSGNFRQGKEFN